MREKVESSRELELRLEEKFERNENGDENENENETPDINQREPNFQPLPRVLRKRARGHLCALKLLLLVR